ncbi:MAG: hypothetical protein EAZ15_06750 [Sphingobacteriales bacterium]|nr:MAG: hypothetical protein EAZ15_06750 [Sphingobacteriales bacterium]
MIFVVFLFRCCFSIASQFLFIASQLLFIASQFLFIASQFLFIASQLFLGGHEGSPLLYAA